MQAIQIEQTGGPEVLQLIETAPPQPAADQVLVKLEACGINFIDTYHRSGLYPVELPAILGLEGAGRVEAVGSSVTQFKPGDRVAYPSIPSSYAQYNAIPEDRLVKVPDNVSLELAAASMLQGLTGHALTHSTYPVSADSQVLIHAAAGGAGQLLVQLCKMKGARVIGTVSTEAKAEIARQAGADDIIFYNDEDFVAETLRLTDGIGVDVIYDSVGKTTFLPGLDALRRCGTMVLFGNASGAPEPINPALLMQKGSLFLTRPILFDYIATNEQLLQRSQDLFSWLQNDEISIRIDQQFPLAEAATAHRLLEGRQTAGKLLLKP
ncbi:MAG: quinone oxidoreductase [Immundisolibacteraceae bacterium]|nr:quinone oxidoreductase [Immundisolibacteraceae bacterium]